MKTFWIALLGNLLILGWPGDVQAQSDDICSNILGGETFYSLKPHLGEPVGHIYWLDTPLSLSKIHAESAYQLGVGAEGIMYRIRPRGGSKSYLLKSFHPGEEQGAEETRNLLGHWHELEAKLSGELPLQVVAPRRGPLPYTLIFDDVRADTVQDILRSDQYSDDLKSRLVHKLMAALEVYKDEITKAYPQVKQFVCVAVDDHWDSRFISYLKYVPELCGLKSTQDKNLFLYFSGQNILYDRDRDLFLILDPV